MKTKKTSFFNKNICMESITKDYIIDELSAGVIVTDQLGNVAYYNKAAARVFPELETESANVIERIKESIDNETPITFPNKIYTFEEKFLDTPSGKDNIIYVMIDSTEHYRHLKEIEEASYTDSLTGLKNRRAFDDALSKSSDETNNAVVYCDLNSLKYINDNFGHSEGDRYITDFAGLLKEFFSNAVVCRVSGDEFVVLMSDIEPDKFEKRMIVFRSIINSKNKVASFGYSRGRHSLMRLVKEAETLMYEDKNKYYIETGKDRRK